MAAIAQQVQDRAVANRGDSYYHSVASRDSSLVLDANHKRRTTPGISNNKIRIIVTKERHKSMTSSG